MNTLYDRLNFATGLNVLAGLWLIASAWVLAPGTADAAMWNSVVVGTAIVVVAAIRFAGGPRWATFSWLNVVLGGWMIASPWIYRYVSAGGRPWNSAVVGIVVLVLACFAESAPETWRSGEQEYHPTAGWDYPYYAHPQSPGEPPIWYATSEYGKGGLGDSEPQRPGSAPAGRSVVRDRA